MATIAQELALEQLYIAYFGRAAEPSGFAFFLNGITAGTDSLPHIANEFANSPESHLLYPFLGLSASTPITPALATAFINQVYHNLFNRDADSVGLAYYVSVLNATNAGDVINGIANGASGSDVPALQGKDLAALNYTTSVTDATYTNGDSVAAVAGAYTLTTGTDIATANIFNAPLSSTGLLSVVNTLQDTDKLTGVGTNPTLNAILGTIDGLNAGAQSHIVTPWLKDIQTINLDFVGNGGIGGFSTTTTSSVSSGSLTLTTTTTTTSNLSGAVDTLDLQDSNANSVKSININRITDPVNSVAVVNITGVPTNFSVNNTHSPTASVSFNVLDAVLAPGADGYNHSSTTVTLNNVTLQDLNLTSSGDINYGYNPGISTDLIPETGIVEHFVRATGPFLWNTPGVVVNANGIENVTLVSKGATNVIGTFSDVDLTTLTITGDQNLTIEQIGYLDEGKFTTIDGSKATGKLNLTLDTLQAAADATPFGTTGGDVAFHLTTGSGDDTINSTINFGSHQWISDADHSLGFNDVVDAGAGFNTLALSSSVEGSFTGSGTVSFTDNATYKNFEAVTVTRTTPRADGYTLNMWVDSSNIIGDQTFSLVNKQDGVSGDHNTTNYYLEKLSATEATSITITHSGLNAQSAGNNAVGDNVIWADLAVGTSNDTVGVTIATGTNSDPRFNFTIEAGSDGSVSAFGSGGKVENIIISDNDNESNTVAINANPADVTKSITIKGGVAGEFLNLDTAGGSAEQAGFYGLDQTGNKTLDWAYQDAREVLSIAGSDTGKTHVSAIDAKVAAVYGANSYEIDSDNGVTGSFTFVAKTIDASLEKSDVIVRVGAADQLIKLGSGNDTVVFSDRSGITAGTAGFSIADTVSGGAGLDTIVFDGSGSQTIRYTEWDNVTGIDVVRLGGVSGSSFTIELSNLLAAQSDSGNRIVVINNEGDLDNNILDANTATIDFTHLDGTHYGTFIGANGDGSDALSVRKVQTVILNDVTANTAAGHNVLDGGDSNVLTDYTDIGTLATGHTFTTQAKSDTAWNSASGYGHELSFYFSGSDVTSFDGGLSSHTDGNNNVLQINNQAVVTVGDLANTQNFHTIEFHNTTTTAQELDLTLDSATVDALADASHVATLTQTEALTIKSIDSLSVPLAYSVLNLQAGSVGAQFSLTVDLSQANAHDGLLGATAGFSDILHNTIVTGAGNDVINLGLSTGSNLITPGAGADIINIGASTGSAGNGSADTIIYNATGQTFQGVVDANTILNPTVLNPVVNNGGADIVRFLATSQVASDHLVFDLSNSNLGVVSGTSSSFAGTTGNLLSGTTDSVHVTQGLYDLTSHEFAVGTGSGSHDALVQWDTNGTAAGGVESVVIIGTTGEHVTGIASYTGHILTLTIA